jgi:murein DD-endopeptidase MepM/ murein hydrolase activator NlpD
LFALLFAVGIAVAPSVGPQTEASPQAEAVAVSAAPIVSEQAMAAWDERAALVRASRSAAEPVRLSWPTPGPLTSIWGEGRNHPGVDLDGETGDPIAAAGPGVVTVAGDAPAGYSGYGLMVVIDHGEGISTLYSHLSVVGVAVGDVLDAGHVIGAIGTTGAVTGSHLHFEVRLNGAPVDPEPWLPPHERHLL